MTGSKNVFSQMFDVRPVTKKGELDVKRIKKVTGILDLRQSKTQREILQAREALKIVQLASVAQKEKIVPVEKSRQVRISIQKAVWQKKARKKKKIHRLAEKPKTTLKAAFPVFQLSKEDAQQKEYFSLKLGEPAEDIFEEIKQETEKEKAKQVPQEIELKEIELESKEIAKELLEQIPEEIAPQPKEIDKTIKPVPGQPRPESEPEIKGSLEEIPDDYFDLAIPDIAEEPSVEEFLVKEAEILLPEEELPTKDDILAELVQIDKEEQDLKKKLFGKKKKLRKRKPKLNIAAEQATLATQALSAIEANQAFEQALQIELKEEIAKKKKKEKKIAGFLMLALVVALLVPLLNWVNQGLRIKENVLSSSFSAYQNLLAAKESLEQTDWSKAQEDFGLAYTSFLSASSEIKKLGQLTIALLERMPGGQMISSGEHLVGVGENLAKAGQHLSKVANLLSGFDFQTILAGTDDPGLLPGQSLTDLLSEGRGSLNQALFAISLADQELEQVAIDALPDEIKQETLLLKEKLPMVAKMIDRSFDYSKMLLDILGHDISRQYLLLFQNNSEMRATGGFIGTYGLLTLDKGQIKKLFVEGIFNADGQLREKIIPPRPIQKISTAWSMHDANWFLDFPTSAKKVAWFYEKTGGPTVDGVISLTPTVFERLLELTGSIEMPQYNVILTADNFVELIQYKVEIDYDKELNQPKKILSDFTPKFIAALRQLPADKQTAALQIIFDALKEKHILIYLANQQSEEFIKQQGWGGQVLATDRDYLSVVSSNINGYKTDRVVEESIEHQTEIQPDGSIIDTVIVTRKHLGGQTNYQWWNRVNTDYIRVYLPLGSQLISATGQAREIYAPPINYQEQGFKADTLVKSIEDKMYLDKRTGTEIFEESGKTVFGNWTYISPGETVKLIYKYQLPFKINLTRSSDSYSLLVQKQSGSLGSKFKSTISYPAGWRTAWQYPDNWSVQTDLKTDKLYGLTFEF